MLLIKKDPHPHPGSFNPETGRTATELSDLLKAITNI